MRKILEWKFLNVLLRRYGVAVYTYRMKFSKAFSSSFSKTDICPTENTKLRISPWILKFETASVGYSGPRGPGETDSWKNLESKISCQTPFKKTVKQDMTRDLQKKLLSVSKLRFYLATCLSKIKIENSPHVEVKCTFFEI